MLLLPVEHVQLGAGGGGGVTRGPQRVSLGLDYFLDLPPDQRPEPGGGRPLPHHLARHHPPADQGAASDWSAVRMLASDWLLALHLRPAQQHQHQRRQADGPHGCCHLAAGHPSLDCGRVSRGVTRCHAIVPALSRREGDGDAIAVVTLVTCHVAMVISYTLHSTGAGGGSVTQSRKRSEALLRCQLRFSL